jgi:hypothetical protein
MDGEDRNDSREVLTRTSHTTGGKEEAECYVWLKKVDLISTRKSQYASRIWSSGLEWKDNRDRPRRRRCEDKIDLLKVIDISLGTLSF